MEHLKHHFPVIDEPYHRSLRTTASFLWVVALCGLVLALVWMEWLPLPKMATTVNLAIFVIVSGICNITFRHGFQSLAYRVSNFAETETLLIGFTVELALTSPDNPILWAFFLIQTLMSALVVGANVVGLLGVALPPLVLGIVTYFWGSTDNHHLVTIGTSGILASALYWWIGMNRLQQVELLEKSLRTENELSMTSVALENERKLRALENDWIDALEKTTGALFVFDATGQCLAARGAELSHAATVDQHIHPDLLPLIDKADATALPVSIFGHKLGEGGNEYFDITVLRLPGEGSLKRFVMMLHTATERIHLELQNKDLNNRLLIADKMASLGVLAAGVAHEINNPLTYISGNIEYILGFPEMSDKLKYPLQDIQSGFKQIERIVGDLRNFSHTTRSPVFESVDLRGIVERTARLVAPEIRPQASFELDLPETPVMASCQADRIQQIVLNLIINARQALPVRHPSENRIRVSLAVEGDWAVLHVEDNGLGISEDILRKVFDPFFTTKAPGVGTGLGLSVSYEIAREHKGQIFVKSAPNKSTTFTLSLPLNASNIETIPILVIDDDDRTLSLFARLLRGFDVTTATSVAAATPLLNNPYRAVLCDLRLSDGSGFDVHNNAPEALKSRFIFLATLPLSDTDQHLRPPNARFIYKPIQSEELELQLLAVANYEDHGQPV